MATLSVEEARRVRVDGTALGGRSVKELRALYRWTMEKSKEDPRAPWISRIAEACTVLIDDSEKDQIKLF